MRNTLVSLIVLVGCVHPAAPNLAVRAMRIDSPNVPCDPYFTNDGPSRMNSCVMTATKIPLYCSLNTEQSSVLCSPLIRLSSDLQPKPAETKKEAPPAATKEEPKPEPEKPKSTPEPKKK